MIQQNLVLSDRNLDEHNKTVLNKKGEFVPKCCMFVDDLLSTIPCHMKNARHYIPSSIESVYILIGYPGAIIKLDLLPIIFFGQNGE